MRATFAAFGACSLLAIVLVTGCGSQEPQVSVPTPAEARTALVGSPAPLAALHRQAGQLLEGGEDAFDARLQELRGRPLVVNKWASWCGPCRFEFPFFQRTAVRFGRQIAFVGLNAGDTDGPAREFLHKHWIPYPSYTDPHEQIARAIGAPNNYPITVFYSGDGKVAYVHQGQYRDEQQLVDDIQRYARRSA
jgi:thiol-disulfide isomerase/thioredoxin